MSVYTDIDAALATLDIPYYHGMPDFDDNEPEIYAAYSITGKPEEFASGENLSESYMVSVSLFTPDPDLAFYGTAKAAFKSAGFTVQSFGDVSTEKGYPRKIHYNFTLIKQYDGG